MVSSLLNRLSIVKKFGYSYALGISISVIVISIGLIIAEYYQQQAQKILDVDYEKYKQLLTSYEKVKTLYYDRIEELWQEIDPFNLKLAEIPKAQQKIVILIATL